MSSVQAMLDTRPRSSGSTTGLAAAIEALEECTETCVQCADACVAEDMVADLRRCIRLNLLDCAALCAATAAVLGRRTEGDLGVVRAAIEACVAACDACAEACRGALSSLGA